MKYFRLTAAVVLAVFVVVGAQAMAADVSPLGEIEEINFGIISTESTAGLKMGFQPFLDDMSKAMGMKVNAFFAPDYAGVIEGMRFGKVHVAWFGNKSAMEAVDRAGGEVFAQTVDVQGNPGYWSLILVHKDSPYQNIDDIIAGGKDLTFGNGDPNSTSGYLIPSYYIWGKKGIDPVKHFKRVTNANHETNALSVATKRVDFATNNTESLGRVKVNKPELYEQIRVIWKSPLIPSDPFVWRKDLPEDLKAAIKAFVLGYGRLGPNAERERKVLAGMSSGWAPFHNSDNRQLLPIREIALAKDKMKLENAGDLGNAQMAKIKELDNKLAKIQEYGKLQMEFRDNK
ncbi:MAG: phosphonate ABC transporter substrate-binding protein [Desulfobacteraceae bacterium]|nr:phosphonate ABC transporter substrate-binding protein [Desulfobacteraceae bacterium]